MQKYFLKATLLTFFAAALAGPPAEILAQSTNKTATTEKKEAAGEKKEAKKASAGPFHGKLAAMDKTAKTITVGKRTFQITSETKMKKGGKPATMADGLVGEEVSGYVKPAEDGKLFATTVTFGPKVEKAVIITAVNDSRHPIRINSAGLETQDRSGNWAVKPLVPNGAGIPGTIQPIQVASS